MKKVTMSVLVLMLTVSLQAQSVKLPSWNCVGTNAAVSYFFQPIDGLSMLGEDGALFLLMEMPFGETKLTSGDNYFDRYLLGTGAKVLLNNKFCLKWSPLNNLFKFVGQTGAGKVVIETDTLAFDDVFIGETTLLVIIQRSGDTFTIRAVSGQDGTVYNGTSQDLAGYVINAVNGGDGFAVGGVANTADDIDFDRSRGHNGNMELVGYATSVITDSAAQAIALGSDPVTVLGESNLRWYRHFSGGASKDSLYAETSNDSTLPSIVRGAEYMVNGATIRRQARDRYLRLDYIPDGRVWGLTTSEQTSKTVTLTGTQAGLTAGDGVEVQVINSNSGATVVDWTALATIGAGSDWSGSFTMPISHGWDYVEIRSAADTSLVWRSRSRCGVGYKMSLMGQSENAYLIGGYNDITGGEYRDTDGAVSLVGAVIGNPLSSGQHKSFPQIYVAAPWDRLGDGVITMARQLRHYTDAPICIVKNAESGTSARAMADDDNDGRRWEYLDRQVRLAGSDFSLLNWMWFAADRGFGLTYGAKVFDPVVLGIQTDWAGAEHFVYDGTFDSSTVFAPALHWGSNCQETTYVGDIFGDSAFPDDRSLGGCMISQYLWQQEMADGREGEPWSPTVSQAEFPVGYDIQGDRYHGGHSDQGSPYGPTRLGYRVGEFWARVLGFSTSQNPRQQNAWFTPDRTGINVRFSLPNGGILRTGTDSLVYGMWTSENYSLHSSSWYTDRFSAAAVGVDGAYWNTDGHTARIVDAENGIVRLTKTSGTWADSTVVGFALWRLPLEQMPGYLYEGPADGGLGTGALAMEDGLGIPVQPYYPVPHATALVQVQETDPGTTGTVSAAVPSPPVPLPLVPGSLFNQAGQRVERHTAPTGIYFEIGGDGTVSRRMLVR